MINYDATGSWSRARGYGARWKRWEAQGPSDIVTGMLHLAPKKNGTITMYLDTEQGKEEIIATGNLSGKKEKSVFLSQKAGSLGFLGPTTPRADVWGEGISIIASLDATNTNLFNYAIFGTLT